MSQDICDHGQLFDHRKRWCTVCAVTVASDPTPADDENPWRGKGCPNCSALWPEHVQEFMALLAQEGPDAVMERTMETVH